MATQTPIKIAVTKVRCLIETDEVGSDEPYILVTGVNLKPPLPNVEVTRYGPWGDVDEGELLRTQPIPAGFNPDTLPIIVWRRLCWGLNGNPAPINHPDDVILLVSMMENDDGSPSATRTIVKGAAVSSLAASVGTSRANRVSKLINDINGALNVPTGAPNFDDRVGSTKELRLSQSLLDVETGVKAKNLLFTGDGGQYRVSVRDEQRLESDIARHLKTLWRSCAGTTLEQVSPRRGRDDALWQNERPE